jgi:predicted RNA-binding protein YlxR (DUF448 family)
VHVPRRRCVGCGRIAPKSELMRIALADGGKGADVGARRAVHDAGATMPGRGAYLCAGGTPAEPRAQCLAQATRRNAIARALRAKVSIDPKLVESIST